MTRLVRASLALNLAAPFAFLHWFGTNLVIEATGAFSGRSRTYLDPEAAPGDLIPLWIVFAAGVWAFLELAALAIRRQRA